MTESLPQRKGAIATLDADGNTGWIAIGSHQSKVAGKLCLFIGGTFGGGTANVQLAPDSDGSVVIQEGTDLTDDGLIELTAYGPNVYFRVTLASSTSPDLSVYAV